MSRLSSRTRSVSPAIHFERTDLIGDVVNDVTDVQGVEETQEEVEVHFQAGFRFGLVQPARLLKQQHAEAIKSRVAQRQTILGFVHSEAAGPAGAGGDEDVAVDDLLLGQAFLFQVLDKLHKVADGEVGGIALSIVAILFAELEGLLVGHRDRLALVAEAFQRAMDQLFVLPGEAAEENGGVVALGLGKGALDGLVELLHRPLLQPRLFFEAPSFVFELLADQLLFRRNLNQAPVAMGRFIKGNSTHASPRLEIKDGI